MHVIFSIILHNSIPIAFKNFFDSVHGTRYLGTVQFVITVSNRHVRRLVSWWAHVSSVFKQQCSKLFFFSSSFHHQHLSLEWRSWAESKIKMNALYMILMMINAAAAHQEREDEDEIYKSKWKTSRRHE